MPYRLAALFTSSPFDDDTPWLNIMVRLKAGLAVPAGSAALRTVQPQVRAAAMPAKPRQNFCKDPLTLAPAGLGASMLRQRFERPLLVIFAVVALVLLVACANVGNLLLARGIARRHRTERPRRAGASRWRPCGNCSPSSVLLSTLGALGRTRADAVREPSAGDTLSTSRDPIALDLALDWRVLAFTVATTAMTAIALVSRRRVRATRVAPIEALNAQGRRASGETRDVVQQPDRGAGRALAGARRGGGALRPDLRTARGRVSRIRSESWVVVSVNAPTVSASERARLFGRLAQAAGARRESSRQAVR